MSATDTPPSAQNATPDVTLALCRAPLWRGSPNIGSAAAMALFVVCLVEMSPRLWRGKDPQPENLLLLALSTLWLFGLGVNFVRRAWVRRLPMPPVVFRARTVDLPLGPESMRNQAVRYDEVLTIGQAERPFVSAPWTGSLPQKSGAPRLRQWQHFFVESRRAVYSLPQPMFRDVDGHERFFYELQRRIAELPQGTRALVETERRRLPALRAMRRRPWATQAIFGVAAVFYLNTWLKGALNTPFGLLRWGAVAPALLGHAGEAYRICAASFLHGQWPHALVNALGLRSLGTLTERLLGWQRMLLIFLVSGAAAMAASAWASEALMSVGSSGALFGLLGAFAVLNVRLGSALPLGVRQPWPWWALLLAINGGLSALVPVLDWVAHVTGFGCGALLTLAMLGRRRELPRRAGRGLQVAALAVVAVYAAALVQAVARAARTRTSEAQIAHLLSHDARTPASTLNHFALYWAIDPHSSPEHLRAGEMCAEQAVRRAPEVADYQATLGELMRRLGDRRSACTAWRRAVTLALAAGPDVASFGLQPRGTLTAFYAAKLARNYTDTWQLPRGATAMSVAPVGSPGPAGLGNLTAGGGADGDGGPGAVLLERPVAGRREGVDWVLDAAAAPTGFAQRLWLVAGGPDGASAVLVVERGPDAPWPWRLAPELRGVLQDSGAAWLALVDVEPLVDSTTQLGWRAFRLPAPRGSED